MSEKHQTKTGLRRPKSSADSKVDAVPNYSAGRNVVIYNQPRHLKIRAAIAYHRGWKELKYSSKSTNEFVGVRPGYDVGNFSYIPHFEKEPNTEFFAVIWLAARGMRL